MNEKSFRQIVVDEINNLKNDFRLLWVLRHYHNLQDPLYRILIKLKALDVLLKRTPKKKCLNCGCDLN
jgi:hypothetical protein